MVLVLQLCDLQLGLFLAHLLDGNIGLITTSYVKNVLVTAAKDAGDTWAAAMLLWGIGQHHEAVDMLIYGRKQCDGIAGSEDIFAPAGDGVGVLEWVAFHGGLHCTGRRDLLALSRVARCAAYRLDTMGHVVGALECMVKARALERVAVEGGFHPVKVLQRTVFDAWMGRLLVTASSRAFLSTEALQSTLPSVSSCDADDSQESVMPTWRNIAKHQLLCLEVWPCLPSVPQLRRCVHPHDSQCFEFRERRQQR